MRQFCGRCNRVSDVICEHAHDPTLSSIAAVRRADLELHNNLIRASYGYLNVQRVEVMPLLGEAFHICKANEIKRLFGCQCCLGRD